MKGILCTAITLIMTILLLTPPVQAKDKTADALAKKKNKVKVSLGAIVWYSWWKPAWMNEEEYNKDAGFFLYGPALSIKFSQRFSLSSSFILGWYEDEMQEPWFALINPALATTKTKRYGWKYDGDILLNIYIKKWFKIFFGPKLQGYYLTREMSALKNLYKHIYGGFGAGFSFNINLVENLYLLPNLSGTLLLRKVGNDKESEILIAGGCNGSLSLGYYITKANLTVSLGFRAQYLYYSMQPSDDFKSSVDIFYGAFLSLVYSF